MAAGRTPEWWQHPERWPGVRRALAPLALPVADGDDRARYRRLRLALGRLAALLRPGATLAELLRAIPAGRRAPAAQALTIAAPGHGPHDPTARRRALEVILEAVLDGPSRRLASYGTLAPGRPNHWVLACLPGCWRPGIVRGRLRRAGWAAELGYPALALDATAAPVPVEVLESSALPEHWARIDAFEGDGYWRTLALVELAEHRAVAANLYAARR